jgi:hypothetical protein
MLEATNGSESGRETHELLLGTHVVFALIKRWVLSTLQGSVLSEHLQATSTSGCSASTGGAPAAEGCRLPPD